MQLPRSSAVAVPFGDGRRVLLAGGARVNGINLDEEILCASGSCSCGAPPCVETLPGFGAGRGRYGLTGTRVDCDEGKGAIYLVGGNYKELVSQEEETFSEIWCLDLQDPSTLQHVGDLQYGRTGHTTTLVRGTGGKPRLLVAGGAGRKQSGEETIWDTAELIEVSCDCQPIAAAGHRLVALRSQRASHSATLLSDGSVLLVGGIFVGDSAERFTPDL
jgi:hypothetical protein